MTLLRAIAILILVGTIAAVAAEKPGAVFGSPDRFAEQGGKSIYDHVCAGCHMPGGKGAAGAGIYPSLTHDARLEIAGYPIAIVLHGQKAMPALGDYLTDRQVADVVTYIRTHFGNRYKDAPSAADVKAAR